ncbi:MAG: hypothetical protein QF570_19460 [Myxococcota bacterium]|nr:hypothetical protein [Myxococcota bacterium]
MAIVLLGASAAWAEPIDLGGRTGVAANFSVTTLNSDDFSDDINVIFFNATVTRTTETGRFEFGGSLTVSGTIFGDIELTTTTPSALIRINTDPLGPEENIVLYAGFLAGLSVSKAEGVDGDDETDEVGAFGPKFGAEYYFTPNLALQLEDTLIFDTEKNISNALAIGAKYLF